MADAGGIVAGPDGNVWFTEPNVNAIGRIGPTGVVSQFLIANPNSSPQEITAGPDGDLWFTEAGSDRIGRITPSGAISERPIRTGSDGIAAGSDGDIWFTEEGVGRIGRLSPSGTLTEFTIPSRDSEPSSLVAGPDGNLWFTETPISGPKVGVITPQGAVAQFPLPRDQVALGIAAGPDGDLWFTTQGSSTTEAKIGRMTTGGAISEFPVPGSFNQPVGITAGPDGNVWFTDMLDEAIRRITPTGTITEWPVSASPADIAAGPDGSLWFTEFSGGKVGRITPQGAISEFSIPVVIRCVVPSLWGKTLAQARRALHRAHCALGGVAKLTHAKQGHRLAVVWQSPLPSSVFPRGAKVNLRLG